MAASIKTTTDLIAFAIASLGYTPSSSFVIIFAQKGEALGLMRADSDSIAEPRAWAQMVSEQVARLENIDATYFLSFEGIQKVTDEQHTELGDELAHLGAPLKDSIIVTNTTARRWDDEPADAIELTDLDSSPVALELMHSNTNIRCSAENIPPAPETIDQEGYEKGLELAHHLDNFGNHELSQEIGAEIIRWNTENGTINEHAAAIVAGLVSNIQARDAILLSCFTADDVTNHMSECTTGRIAPHTWDYVKGLEEAFFNALTYTPTRHRPHILTVICWMQWLQGESTKALGNCEAAHRIDPDTGLTQLLKSYILQLGPALAATQNR